MSSPKLSVNSIAACMVCTELYNEKEQRPKLLQCGHTFCLRCLNEILKAARQRDSGETRIPCPNCRQTTPLSSFNALDLTDNFAIIGYLSSANCIQEAQCYCKKHPDERIKFFCIPCQRLLCPCCALKHVSQKFHNVVKAESAALRYREQVCFALDYCKEKQKLLDKTVQDSLEEKQQLAGLSLSLERLINNASDLELLSQKQTLMQLEECVSQKHLPSLVTSRDLQQVTLLMERSGTPTPPGFWGFPSCSEQNTNCSRIFTERDANATLAIPSSVGSPLRSLGRSQGSLVSPTGVAATHDGFVFVTDHSDQGVQILDSSGEFWGQFIRTEEPHGGKMCSPAGIAISSLGYLVVFAEPEAQQVSVHARDGRRLFYLKLDWQYPFGVAVNSKGQIVVTDRCENGSLSIVTVDWTNGSVLNLQVVGGLKHPRFVACSKKDEIVVTTSHSVQMFDNTGSFLWSVCPVQGNNPVLTCPMGVAIDSNNNIIVSDYCSGKVVLLSSEGRWVMDIVSSGLKGPQGIAAPPSGLLVIADSQHHSLNIHTYRSTQINNSICRPSVIIA